MVLDLEYIWSEMDSIRGYVSTVGNAEVYQYF